MYIPKYSDKLNGHKPDGYPSDILSILAANVANFNVAPEERQAIHAKAVKACLPEAWAALAILENRFGDENGGSQPRFNNDHYTEAAEAAGGTLRMKTIARLCNLGPDDDGEEFVPMTDAELAVINARFIANPEPSF